MMLIHREDGSNFCAMLSHSCRSEKASSSIVREAALAELHTIAKAIGTKPVPSAERSTDRVVGAVGKGKSISVLPLSLPPRGLSRIEAAAYVGVSPTLFDEMVKDDRMPGPKHVNTRRIWDRHALDAAFSALPAGDEVNCWDDK